MKETRISTSLLYKFSEKVSVKAVGFIISVLFARLLPPNIFGVVAIITAVISLAQILVDSGLSTALVQNKNVSESDFSTIFWISMGLAAILYVCLFFLTPTIARYYSIEEYTTAFRVLLLSLFFFALNSIQGAKLQREMLFKKMLGCQLITVLVSGSIGVALASCGYGIWALIIYYLSNSVISCITYWFASKLKLQFSFSIQRAKVLINYGYKILISGVLCSLFANLRTFVIGRIYTTSDLGIYSRGDQIPSIIATSIDSSVNAVMLPAFAKEQDNQGALRALIKRSISLNSMILFPAMFGLAAIAKNMVPVIYTDKWNQAVPFVQVLALANVTVAIFPLCLSAIKAIGRSDIYLKLEIVRRCVMLIILIGSLAFHSLIAIAIGWLISTIIDVFIVMIPIKKLFKYSLLDLWKDIYVPLLISIFMAVCVIGLGNIHLNNLPLMLIQLMGGGLIYFLGVVLFLPNHFHSIKRFLKKRK